jgi:hypothetical protein
LADADIFVLGKAGDGGRAFYGYMSQFTVWNDVVLTAAQIQYNHLNVLPLFGGALMVSLKAINYNGFGTWYDESGSGRNATLETGVAGKNAAGNGIVLNGSTCWNFPNVAVGNSWTAGVWYKQTGASTGTSTAILTQRYTSGNAINLNIGDNHGLNDGNASGGFYNGTWQYGITFTLTNNIWTNIQVTWDGTDLNTYIDGVSLGATQPTGASADNGLEYRIGRCDNDGLNTFVVGEIGEVRIHNYALSAEQVLADYYASVHTFGAYVLLNAVNYSGSGDWIDESGNGYNATLENGVISKNTAGNGIVLNGSSNWTIPNMNLGNAWSVGLWYKNISAPTGGGGGIGAAILTQMVDGSLPLTVNIRVSDSNNQQFFAIAAGANGTLFTLTNGVWTNIQVTWDGSDLVTYINGVSIGSVAGTTPSETNTAAYRIGRRWDLDDYVVGEIGEVRFYGYALNAGAVLSDYNASFRSFLLQPVDIPGISLWIDANDSSAVVARGGEVLYVNDKSGLGNNMTTKTGVIEIDTSTFGGRSAMSLTNTYFVGPVSVTGSSFSAFAVATLNAQTTTGGGRILGLGQVGVNDFDSN